MEQSKAPETYPSEEWAALPWRKLEHHLYRLQKRIFKASARGDLKTVHQLQKWLMKSRSARLLAVRRVTQDNQGKKTAGIDGVKSVSPAGRLALAEAIHPNRMNMRKPKPLRRVWIPKPAKAEQRPLGIPVLEDAAQIVPLAGPFDGLLLFAAHEVFTSSDALDHLLVFLNNRMPTWSPSEPNTPPRIWASCSIPSSASSLITYSHRPQLP
jgi:N-terminal domain of reverse transcriptase